MLGFFSKSEASGYRPSPDVTASEHGGGLVLLDHARGAVHTSNPVGARIWRGLDAGEPLEAIASSIARDFGVADSVARADAGRFVDELRAAGLLVAGGRRG